MVVNYKNATRKTAVLLYLLIVAESMILPFLSFVMVMGTKYMGMDELSSIVFYLFPLAFAYTVPVVIWPMLCFYKLLKNKEKCFGNLFPLMLGICFALFPVLTKFINMGWHFAEVFCFELRMFVLMISLPVYSFYINKTAGSSISFTKRIAFFAICVAGCMAMFLLIAERKVVENSFLYILIYEMISCIGQWVCIKTLRKKE